MKCGSRAVHKLFKKTMQKLSAKLSKGGPRHLWKRRGQNDRLHRPHLISTPEQG